MKLEKQVASLELAEKLKELGVKQESYLGWFTSNSPRAWLYWSKNGPFNSEAGIGNEHCSAFTVAELGEMLPKDLYDEEDGQWDNVLSCPNENDWICAYRRYYGEDGTWSTTYVEMANTEADARAKMLIFLIENGFMEVKLES